MNVVPKISTNLKKVESHKIELIDDMELNLLDQKFKN